MRASWLRRKARREERKGGREELTGRPRKARASLGAAALDGDDGGRRQPRRRGEVDPERAVVPELDDEV